MSTTAYGKEAIPQDTTNKTSLRIQADLWKRVRTLAVMRGTTAQRIVDDALRAYLSKHKTAA